MHGQLPSGARGLNCVSSVHLHLFFVCTSSEDSGQCAHVCTLTCAFFAEHCNKHQHPMSLSILISLLVRYA